MHLDIHKWHTRTNDGAGAAKTAPARSRSHGPSVAALVAAAVLAALIAVATAFAATTSVKTSPTFSASVESISSRLNVNIGNNTWDENMRAKLLPDAPLSYEPFVSVNDGLDAYVFMSVQIPCASGEDASDLVALETHEGWTIIDETEPEQTANGGFARTIVYGYSDVVQVGEQSPPVSEYIRYLGPVGEIESVSLTLEAMSIQAEGFRDSKAAWEAYRDQEINGDGSSFDSINFKDDGDGMLSVRITDTSIILSENFSLFSDALVPGMEQHGIISLANDCEKPQQVEIEVDTSIDDPSANTRMLSALAGKSSDPLQALLEKTKLTVSLNRYSEDDPVAFSGTLADIKDGRIELGVVDPGSTNIVSYQLSLDNYAQDEIIGTSLNMHWTFLAFDYVAPGSVSDGDGSENGTGNGGSGNAGNGSGSSGASGNGHGSTPAAPPAKNSTVVGSGMKVSTLSKTGDETRTAMYISALAGAAAMALAILAVRGMRRQDEDEC